MSAASLAPTQPVWPPRLAGRAAAAVAVATLLAPGLTVHASTTAQGTTTAPVATPAQVAAAAQATTTSPLATAAPAVTTTHAASATHPASANRDHTAFLRLVVPKTQLYVGELLPVQVKGYFRTDVGVSLNAPPVVRNDAFTTTSNLTGPPAQAHELIDGVPYVVVTWSSAVVPIKNGAYTLALELPVTLQIREPTTPRPATLDELFGANPLNGPLFNNSAMRAYFSRVVEKSMLLKADAIAVTVLPLPATGRPADFSGAVGSFDVMAQATTHQGRSGGSADSDVEHSRRG